MAVLTKNTRPAAPVLRAVLDENGHELVSNVPVAPPIGYVRELTLIERMRMQIRREMSLYASTKEMETFEEADDFDIPDDPLDPLTPYELHFDPAYEVAGSPEPPAGDSGDGVRNNSGSEGGNGSPAPEPAGKPAGEPKSEG